MSDEQLLVTLGVQDKGASTQIKSLNKELKYLDKEFKTSGKSSKQFENTTEGLTKKLTYLEKSYDANKLKLDAYRKKQEETQKLLAKKQEELEKLNKAEGDNSAAIAKTEKQMDSYRSTLVDTDRNINLTENQLENLTSQIKETEKAFKSKAAEEYSKSFTKVGSAVTNVGDKITGLGKKVSVLSAGVAGVGIAAISTFKGVKEGTDNLIKATGATGEAADKLKETFKDISRDSEFDFGTIGSALGEINTRFGFTEKAAEDCTKSFLDFAKITNTDATEAVKLVSRAMGDAGIESSEYSKVLDILALAAQASGISIDVLTENLTKYGAPMRALGFDTKESIAIFSTWEKAGVNTEIAFSGMKKAISSWSSDGKDARVEFKKTLEQIKATPNIAAATTKAIEVFGQKAGPDLADAIKGGRFEYSEFLKLLEGSEGTVSKTARELEDGTTDSAKALNAAKIEFAEFGKVIITEAAPAIKTIAKEVKKAGEWFKNLSDEQKENIVKIGLFVVAAGPMITAIGTLTSGTGKLITNTGKMISTFSKLGSATRVGTRAISGMGATSATSAAGMGGLASGALALTPTILLAAGAIEVLKTQQDLNNMSILESTDNMGPLEKALNTLGGGYHKTNEELIEMGIVYEEFSNNVTPTFKKAVEDSADRVRDFNQVLKDTSLDGVITKEEGQDLSKRVEVACQEAIAVINSYEEPGKQALLNAFNLDGKIDINEQAILDAYTKKGDIAKEEVTRIGQKILDLEKAQEKEYSAAREEEIKQSYQKIEEIRLTSEAKTQAELNAIHTNWLEQIETISAEKASEYLVARAAERDANNADTIEKNAEAIKILNEMIEKTTGAEKEGYQAQKATLEQSNTDKLMENRKAFTQYYEELKLNNAAIAENINMVTGEIMDKEKTKLQNRLINMKKSMVGMNDITKTGYYQMYNTVTGTMDTVGVVVDEKTGLITGAFNKSSGESGQAMDGMMLKAQELANTSSLTSATIGSNYAQLSSTTVNASNQIISKNGEVIGSLKNITTNADGTRQGIINLNGVPINVKVNDNGVISTLDGVLSRMRTISGSAVTVSMRQTWTSDGRGGVYVPEGYASGTTNATRGVHLVGEEGPELIYFSGGETVLNTVDTSKVLTNGSYFNPDSVESGNLMNTVNNYNSTNYSNTSNNAGIDGAALASQIASAIAQALSKSPLIASVDIDRLGRAVTPTVERTITSKQIGRRLSK